MNSVTGNNDRDVRNNRFFGIINGKNSGFLENEINFSLIMPMAQQFSIGEYLRNT
jgi:hypothetical protein